MAYVGRSPRYGFLEGQTATFDGSTTTVTLQRNVSSTDAIDVYIDNVHQEPDVAYTLSSGGNSITFTGTPENGAVLYIRFHGISFDTTRAYRLENSDGGSTATLGDDDSFTLSLDGTTALSATSSGVTIANLTVTGTTTTINSTDLNIGDNKITLNSDLPSDTAPTENAGIVINRGSSPDVEFIWDESVGRWYSAKAVRTGSKFETLLSGSLPTIGADTVGVFANAATGESAYISIIGNSAEYSGILFCDENAESSGYLRLNHTSDVLETTKPLHTTNSYIKVGDASASGYETSLGHNALTFSRSGASYIDQAQSDGTIAIRFGSTYVTPISINTDGTTFNKNINMSAGNIQVGGTTVIHSDRSATFGNTVNITNGANLSTLNADGYLLIGSEASYNMAFDENEIQARNGGGANQLILQKNGGNTSFGTTDTQMWDNNAGGSTGVVIHADGFISAAASGLSPFEANRLDSEGNIINMRVNGDIRGRLKSYAANEFGLRSEKHFLNLTANASNSGLTYWNDGGTNHYFKPFDGETGNINLGKSSAKWNDFYLQGNIYQDHGSFLRGYDTDGNGTRLIGINTDDAIYVGDVDGVTTGSLRLRGPGATTQVTLSSSSASINQPTTIEGVKSGNTLKLESYLATAGQPVYNDYQELRFSGNSNGLLNAGIRQYANNWQNSDTALAFLTTKHGGSYAERMRVDGDGYVGINTESPNAYLTIADYKDGAGNNTHGVGLRFKSTSTSAGSNSANGGTGIEFTGYGHDYTYGSRDIAIRINPRYEYWGNNNAMSAYGQSYPYLTFDFLNSDGGGNYDRGVLTVAGIGRVGVNTEAPTQALDVDGTVRIQGNESYQNTSTGIYGGVVLRTPAYVEYQYYWSGLASHQTDFFCDSYFMCEVTFTQHQTNGGSDIHRLIKGKWANNHTTHTWTTYHDSGSTWAMSTSIGATDSSGNTGSSSSPNGRLRITETYSNGSYSRTTITLRCYYGEPTNITHS